MYVAIIILIISVCNIENLDSMGLGTRLHCSNVQCYVLPLHLGSAAKPVLWDFLKKYPNAESARQADRRELATMLNPLGLHEKRAQIIIRFSGKLW